MPSLKVWGQDDLSAEAPAAGGETLERGWFRSVEEYRGDRGLGAKVLEVDPIRPGEAAPSSLSRRNFLQLLGGGLGVAGLDACFKPPNGKILPYSKQAPNVLPGEALHFATAYEIDGLVTPLLVTCFDGRPTKVEGNPDHPENLGATGVFEQAILEDLYDPNRLQTHAEKTKSLTQAEFDTAFTDAVKKAEGNQGEGVRLLVGPTSSPFLRAQRLKVLTRFPKAKVVEYRALNVDETQGTALAFGAALSPRYEPEKADVVVALDADPFWTVPHGQRVPRELAKRRVPGEGRPMSRLYVVEGNLSVTGTMADHRLRARSADIGKLALALLHEVTLQRPLAGLSVPTVDVGANTKFVKALAQDLLRSAGNALVFVGGRQPAEVQALGQLLNLALGNIGNTVHLRPLEPTPAGFVSGPEGLTELTKDIDAHKVELLFIAADNPVLSCPTELKLAQRIAAVPASVYLADHWDETARAARWTAPRAHAFETWGDAVAADGSTLVCQPLLAPLFGGRSEAELLGVLNDDSTPAHEKIYDAWHQRLGPAIVAFDEPWAEVLRKGFRPADAQPTREATLGAGAAAAVAKVAQSPAASDLGLGLYASYQVHDGRFGRNGWLQEMPDPITKATWTNVALLSAKTAEKLGVVTGSLLELSVHGRQATLPAYILPGHVDNEVSVALGFGQRSALPNHIKPSFTTPDLVKGTKSVTDEVTGVDAYPLRALDALWFTDGLKARPTGEPKQLALTQEHWDMEGHALALEQPLAALTAAVAQKKHLAGEMHPEEEDPSFYEPYPYKGLKWGMAIDLARCSGCSACVVACQGENNIPIVGEDQVNRGREMHWIRLDRYFTGNDLDNPGVITQPVACVHCETAPCEYVCPVNATVHSDEGLNEMVYNRCIGTRYCSNNCPYHVRRFNYLNYAYDNKTETEKMIFNPDVTVRSRGVMEKCTYCVQRIERGRISARVEGREIKDGDIKTACQSACPTQAISFGSLNDKQSQVAEKREDPRAYLLLKDLGTRPRTTHLVRLKNKNPELS